MRLGIAADDITGANDIGIMLAKAGYLTHVYPVGAGHWPPLAAVDGLVRPDVCILDTNSRLDSPQIAYQKVYEASQRLRQAGCQTFYKKTCSVFRGNVGAEFDAMLDALGEPFAIVVVAFPKNGRLTRDGIHYVHGQKLADSNFRHDPIHPMRESNLVHILQAQTQRQVGLVHHQVVEQGVGSLRRQLAQLKEAYHYVIVDVVSQAALATVAQAVADYPVLCGSSALAEELPAVWNQLPAATVEQRPLPRLPDPQKQTVLCAAGSLTSQTRAQIDYLRQQGLAAFSFNTLALFDRQARPAEIEQVARQIGACAAAGRDVLLHTPYQPALVHQTQQAGEAQGLSRPEIGRLVSEAVAEIVAQVVRETGLNRLVIAGGETSAAVCGRLGIHGLQLWQEIQPGLPSCLSLSPPPAWLVLKSGSFGSPDFLEQAIAHLKGL
jgi:uncharacterized protein YgbK (DUF1537 family)